MNALAKSSGWRRPGNDSRSPNDDAPYSYQPLKGDKRETRLLHLLPGVWTAPIRVKLSVIDLDEKHSLPEYEALSYAWGKRRQRGSVIIGDGRHCWSLPVTRNAELALRYLRRERGGRRALWVDAICINQTDTAERSNQVASMVKIYLSARRVVVWLGLADSHSRAAVKHLDQIAARLWKLPEPVPSWLILPEEVLPIYQLSLRPWFGRLWIWQEVMSSKREPLL
ncbi:Heterokaryon incompatibility protein 6, OR allele, partial [Pseudocercospora fuligena]